MSYKILTHDFRSPIRVGEPVWDGKTLPFTLPVVKLDTSQKGCAAGWNYVERLSTGFEMAGLWPTGRPSVALSVAPSCDAITRGNKSRCSALTLTRLATEHEISDAIEEFSHAFGIHSKIMASEQCAWRLALARPKRESDEVIERHLRDALTVRGLRWSVRKYSSAANARDAWDARDARAAWDARAALIHKYAALMSWAKADPDLLAIGIRDAYASGAEIVLPTTLYELGWA